MGTCSLHVLANAHNMDLEIQKKKKKPAGLLILGGLCNSSSVHTSVNILPAGKSGVSLTPILVVTSLPAKTSRTFQGFMCEILTFKNQKTRDERNNAEKSNEQLTLVV